MISYFLSSTNDMFLGLSNDLRLTDGIDVLLPGLFDYIETVMNKVFLPVGYSVLGMFILMELFTLASKSEGYRSNATMFVKAVGMLLARASIFKFLMENVMSLVTVIYEVTTHLTSELVRLITEIEASKATTFLDAASIEVFAKSLGFVDTIFVTLIAFLAWFITLVVVNMIKVIVWVRFVHIYIWVAVAPIPLSTLPNQEWSQIGKSFLKSFTALCLQGSMIYLVVSFFPFLAQMVIGDFGVEPTFAGMVVSMSGLLGCVLVLAITAMGSLKLAQSVCNAM